MDTVSENEQY